ncbi:hypothetical protein M0Q97_10240 [Candidatus Dojkabacteria bacterium]|jgi:hypothetical protein|nr:hypothetical protein [Candidatus Dojkabacteria bacterium]
MKENKKPLGLGDTIEKITEATGIKAVVEFLEEKLDFDCGCDKRKELLNKLFPYKVECLNEEEYEYLKNFNFNISTLHPDNQKRLLAIYNRVFNQHRQMTSCSSCWVKILDELKKVYDQYNQ